MTTLNIKSNAYRNEVNAYQTTDLCYSSNNVTLLSYVVVCFLYTGSQGLGVGRNLYDVSIVKIYLNYF